MKLPDQNGDNLIDQLSEGLNDDLKAIADSLSNTMIDRKISSETMLLGMHAFLMALQASGHADASAISDELSEMSDYFRSLIWKH